MWGRRPGRPGGGCSTDVCDPSPRRAARPQGRVGLAWSRHDQTGKARPGGGPVEIIVKGRHTDVDDRFRSQADAKISKVERLDSKLIRIDVEVSQERNPRQSSRRERVELTLRSRGPVIRA